MTLKRCLSPCLLAVLVLAWILPPADACTTFCLRKGSTAVFGKN